jgi:hypothetical protein
MDRALRSSSHHAGMKHRALTILFFFLSQSGRMLFSNKKPRKIFVVLLLIRTPQSECLHLHIYMVKVEVKLPLC